MIYAFGKEKIYFKQMGKQNICIYICCVYVVKLLKWLFIRKMDNWEMLFGINMVFKEIVGIRVSC